MKEQMNRLREKKIEKKKKKGKKGKLIKHESHNIFIWLFYTVKIISGGFKYSSMEATAPTQFFLKKYYH